MNITTSRQFFRSNMRKELKDTGAKKVLKSKGIKPTFHNQFCVIMGLYKEIRK